MNLRREREGNGWRVANADKWAKERMDEGHVIGKEREDWRLLESRKNDGREKEREMYERK